MLNQQIHAAMIGLLVNAGRMLLLWLCLMASPLLHASPSVAFYYGNPVPVDRLQAYDWAVVEPAHLPSPPKGGNTQWFAYLSLGEITADRPYAKDVPAAWKASRNIAWGSWVIDQTSDEWPAFVVNRMVDPLWKAGYRGFFLDTLDSWQMIAKTDAERQKQIAGLMRTIAAIKARYPEARLIANRGFEVMDKIHPWLSAVAFESYFQGWNAEKRRYQPVSEEDRRWLDGQLKPIREQYRLPVIAIDYVPPADKALALATARKLRQAGFVPWVADPLLGSMGAGALEELPRTVLLLYSGNKGDTPLDSNMQYVATILNYLGYRHRLIDVTDLSSLPENLDDTAGIISSFAENKADVPLQIWLKKQIDRKIPWVVLNDFGFPLTPAWLKRLGLTSSSRVLGTKQVTIVKQSAALGFETSLQASGDIKSSFSGLTAANAEVLLELQNNQGVRYQPVAITDWGGYAMAPFVFRTLPDETNRWVIDPFQFLARALRLPALPVPDVTTENGRRILISHIDGDGFVSQAEMPGSPPAGEVMLKEILQKYSNLPITVSVIEGEIGAEGLYPAKSQLHEKIARQIFALPNVEIASHSYSHPFKWQPAATGETSEDYHLSIPGYSFDLDREIAGTAKYINTRLAPTGKKTRVLLWTGDCDPPEVAVRKARQARLLNMNAGDTVISKTLPTLTAVAPIGMYKGNELQIFAPNQNENVYTNNWTGPFYGYQRVIETFQMTESPRRLKPIDIYYHVYSASKKASLNALKRVYDWAVAQPVTPMFASEYIERAQGFFGMNLSRTFDGRYLISNTGALRTLRLPVSAGYPDMTASRNVAGFHDSQGVRYIHLSTDNAELALRPDKPSSPYLAYANAKLDDWTVLPKGLKFKLQGWVPLRFALGKAQACRLTVAGKPVNGRFDGELVHYQLPQNAASEIKLVCQR
ncbi:hypothetical protein SAMN05660284_02326 [Formivibrio citricus]|uniref:Glycoside-hydrolase family GH114 TIM-barrel domain-containing protein n=2 Tax=Formivibrio citricus TaxID=83765 RepID=A0A1I5C3X1_9NEIS|nr:hypothetical protein SAMN05660284_02326 [Formivibrio citricus]